MRFTDYDTFKTSITVVFFGGYNPIRCQTDLRDYAQQLQSEMKFRRCAIVADLQDLPEWIELIKNKIGNSNDSERPEIKERKEESLYSYKKSYYYAQLAQIGVFLFRDQCPSDGLNLELKARSTIEDAVGRTCVILEKHRDHYEYSSVIEGFLIEHNYLYRIITDETEIYKAIRARVFEMTWEWFDLQYNPHNGE